MLQSLFEPILVLLRALAVTLIAVMWGLLFIIVFISMMALFLIAIPTAFDTTQEFISSYFQVRLTGVQRDLIYITLFIGAFGMLFGLIQGLRSLSRKVDES